VYGPYAVVSDGKAEMDQKIRNHVNFIRGALFSSQEYNADKVDAKGNHIDEFFYDDTKINPAKYAGEWCRHLYGEMGQRGIYSFDIELPQMYNEQVREGKPVYNPNLIGSSILPFFEEKDTGNFVINKNIIGFYNLLRTYFDKKKQVDEKSKTGNK
jgi:hypothetical protein